MSTRIHTPSLLLLLASTGLVWVGTLYPSFWYAAVAGLACFLYGVFFHTNSHAYAALQGALVGFASGGAGVIWMWDMLPLTQPEGMSPLTQIIVAGSVWGVTALLAGVTAALASIAIYRIREQHFVSIIVAIIWILQEELRMWAYAVYSYSPESLFGPHFSQTALAYALTENSYLLQLAHPFGVVGLTFFLGIAASTIALAVRAITQRTVSLSFCIAAGVCVMLLLVPLVFPYKHSSSQSLIASVIHVNPQDKSPEALRGALAQASAQSPDIVVLPEGFGMKELFSDTTTYQEQLANLFNNRDVLIISSNYATEEGGNQYARVTYDHAVSGHIATYDKMFLMPQTEYYPLIAKPLFSLAGDTRMNEYVEKTGVRLTRGDTLKTVPFKGAAVGALLCSEIMSPHLYKELSSSYGASILVNLANPSWFHHSQTLYDKTVQIAKVHAVQNRKPFLLASEDAPSFILDAYGTIVAESAWNSNESISVPIRF